MYLRDHAYVGQRLKDQGGGAPNPRPRGCVYTRGDQRHPIDRQGPNHDSTSRGGASMRGRGFRTVGGAALL